MLIGLISFLRQLFISKHRSLEFRARVIASMMVCKKKFSQVDFKKIENIAWEIYENDFINAFFLKYTVKEFTIKYQEMNYGLDRLLREIDRELKYTKRYINKIDFDHLRELICKTDENEAFLQERVYEFLLNEVKIYSV